eukprot:g65038.t1
MLGRTALRHFRRPQFVQRGFPLSTQSQHIHRSFWNWGSSSTPETAKASPPGPKAPPPAMRDDDPWEEVKDAASGKSYWWNKETDETTVLGAPKPTGNSAVVTADPWKEVKDPATGQSYWWNQITDETTPLGAPKPQPRAPAPQPGGPGGAPLQQQQQGGPGLGGVLMEGMAFGVGSSIAHRAVDSVLGPRTLNVEHGSGSAPATPPPGPSPMADQSASDDSGEQDGDDGNSISFGWGDDDEE